MKLSITYSMLFLCLTVVFLTTCKKEDISVYTAADRININYNDMENLNEDSINIAYGFVTAQKEIINLKLLLMGYPKDYDREIEFTITSKNGASAGIHYEITRPIILPKGEVQVTVPLIILRPADLLQSGPRSFLLQIVDSKDLSAGIQTTLFVNISDDIPDRWIGDETWFMKKIDGYFGECSKTKYMFIYKELNVCDFSTWSIYGFMGDDNKFMPAKRILKERLSIFETENGPLIDPLKGKVTFPN